MKKRFGFVSNSSSSSFIIAVSPDIDINKIQIKISIEDCINNKLTTIEEIQDYFMEDYAYGDTLTWEKLVEIEGDWMIDRYDKMVKELERGNIIVVGSGSSEGDSTAGLAIYNGALHDLDDSNITIIEGGD